MPAWFFNLKKIKTRQKIKNMDMGKWLLYLNFRIIINKC